MFKFQIWLCSKKRGVIFESTTEVLPQFPPKPDRLRFWTDYIGNVSTYLGFHFLSQDSTHHEFCFGVNLLSPVEHHRLPGFVYRCEGSVYRGRMSYVISSGMTSTRTENTSDYLSGPFTWVCRVLAEESGLRSSLIRECKKLNSRTEGRYFPPTGAKDFASFVSSAHKTSNLFSGVEAFSKM